MSYKAKEWVRAGSRVRLGTHPLAPPVTPRTVTGMTTAAPALACIPAVELCQAGTWDASTGRHTITLDDLADAVRATQDPAFRRPVIYLGHTHEKFGDAGPNVGHIDNIRLSDSGTRLLGDLWLLPGVAALAPTVWPSRSIEANVLVKATSSTGNTYGLVLTGLALLGSWAPAIETLADLEPLAIAATAPGDHITLKHLETPMPNPTTTIALSVDVENVRRAWWDWKTDHPGYEYAWCVAVYAGDEQFIIVETEDEIDGSYTHRLDWTETDGDVDFGDPQPVQVAYLPAPASDDDATAMSAPGSILAARFGRNTADSPVRAANDRGPCEVSAAAGTTTTGADMTNTSTTDTPAPAVVSGLPEGVVAIDAAQLSALQAAAAVGVQAAETLRAQERDRVLDAAVNAGRIAPASRAHFGRLYDADAEGTKALIESLEATVVPTVALGHAAAGADTDDALYERLFGAGK